MKRPIRWMLAVMSGVMLSLPWLGFPGWLLFAGFLPLLLLDDFFVREQGRFRSISFQGHAFLSFLIWNGLTTWWIWHATPAGALFAIIVNAFLMSLVFWLAHLARRAFRGTPGYLAYVVFWLSFEFFHYHWDIEWPWLTLGNGFSNNVMLVQWYEYTGVFGGSLWVWLVGILLFGFLKMVVDGFPLRQKVTRGVLLLVVVALPAVWSVIRYHNYEEKEDLRTVLIIQPNIDPYTESHGEGSVNEKLMKFIQIAENNLIGGIDFIVGPETVFEENWDEGNLLRYPAFRQLQELTRISGGSGLVIGASTFRIYREGEEVPATARRAADGLVYDVYNAAIYTGADGGYQVYHKSILVPGVEKMPFRKYLKFLDSFIINLGGTTGTLGKQDEPTSFITPEGDRVAPAICYESAFGGYMAEFIRKGAGAIFIITNDGWWKNTPGYRQHFSFARLRAVESRRSVARSANTGISGFISQRGEVLQRSKWWVEDALTAQINFNDKLTFYVKHGDYIARVSVFMAALTLLNLVVTLIKGKKNPH